MEAFLSTTLRRLSASLIGKRSRFFFFHFDRGCSTPRNTFELSLFRMKALCPVSFVISPRDTMNMKRPSRNDKAFRGKGFVGYMNDNGAGCYEIHTVLER